MAAANNLYEASGIRNKVYFDKVKVNTLAEVYPADILMNYFELQEGNPIRKLFNSSRKTFEMDEQDILNLFDACNEILKNPKLAKELLPVDDDNYDEVYFDTVEEIRDRIKYDILPNLDDNSYITVEFYK